MSSLSGKAAIVTGSGKNIGRAIAMQLAEAGCQVVVNGRHEVLSTCLPALPADGIMVQ